MIGMQDIFRVEVPTLSESVISFHGTWGYFLVLTFMIFAHIGMWLVITRMWKYIIKTVRLMKEKRGEDNE